MPSLTDVKRQHEAALMDIPEVFGVGVGDGEIVVDATADVATLPRTLDGYPVAVHVGDRPTDTVRAGRHRPVPNGASACHVDGSACTVGFVMQDPVTGRMYGISNNHCYADYNRADITDPIIQPSPGDGGDDEEDVIGHLVGYIPLEPDGNVVDLAWMEPTVELDAHIFGVGPVTGRPASVIVGSSVLKSGRTTETTYGTVAAVDHTVDVTYSDGPVRRFHDQIKVEIRSAGGDSGSPVLWESSSGSLHPVGLNFAGNDTYLYCNTAENVADAMRFEFVTAFDPDDVSVTACEPTPETVAPGESFVLSTTVENATDWEAGIALDVFLSVDGPDRLVGGIADTLPASTSQNYAVECDVPADVVGRFDVATELRVARSPIASQRPRSGRKERRAAAVSRRIRS